MAGLTKREKNLKVRVADLESQVELVERALADAEGQAITARDEVSALKKEIEALNKRVVAAEAKTNEYRALSQFNVKRADIFHAKAQKAVTILNALKLAHVGLKAFGKTFIFIAVPSALAKEAKEFREGWRD